MPYKEEYIQENKEMKKIGRRFPIIGQVPVEGEGRHAGAEPSMGQGQNPIWRTGNIFLGRKP